MNWFRTPALSHTQCQRCSETIHKGEPMAYRHGGKKLSRRVCEGCATELGIDARESKRMMKARQLEMSL